MRESTKKALRQRVLEVRAEMRGFIKELGTINREKTRVEESIKNCVDEIRGIQEDCGDSIEIDPQYPEIK
jgi:hypothetical protein